MANSASVRLIQVVSPGKFIQDMFYFTLPLVFFYGETNIPLPFVAFTSFLLIAITATLLYRKKPYNTGSAVMLTCLFLTSILILEGSIVIYLVLSTISIWRLQDRFGSIQLEGVYDLPFIAKISVLYSIMAVALTMFGLTYELSLLTVLLIVMVIISIGTRLFEQWLKAERVKQFSADVVKLFSVVTGTGVIAYLFIRNFGSMIRDGIEWVVLKVLYLFLPFIGSLMEKPIAWLKGLIAARKPRESETPPAETVSEQRQPYDIPTGSEANFPWLPIIIGVAIVIFALIIYRMMKNRIEFEKVESLPFEVERGKIDHVGEDVGEKWLYSMDSHIVREAFIKFETEAAQAGFHRNREETVREWFKRMEWEAEPRFFEVYDSVRYGAGTIAEQDGIWFLEQLLKINKKFFEKDV
ncbi:hypothetical protein ACFOZY_02970 [Chungangia koreensis]|uniref:DUF4129 domain-containing protein n=1 Tax=Chungangia koreensis TaxID=752657 RepID=A0ABV8X1N6_9LACT